MVAFLAPLSGVLLVLALAFWLVTRWVRFVPNNRIGIIEKRFGGGSLRSGFIALNGEAGFQPRVLRGGIHMLTPFQYGVHIMPLVTIPQGKIGYIFARDGVPLEAAQTVAPKEPVQSDERAEASQMTGDQRRQQGMVVREGT